MNDRQYMFSLVLNFIAIVDQDVNKLNYSFNDHQMNRKNGKYYTHLKKTSLDGLPPIVSFSAKLKIISVLVKHLLIGLALTGNLSK